MESKYGMKWNKMEWNGTYWIKRWVNAYNKSGMKWNEMEWFFYFVFKVCR